jgi:hypothetical protein
MTDALPQLLDCRGLMAELGVKRATAEAIMRDIARDGDGIIAPETIRKCFVKRDDVNAWIEQNTKRIA